MMWLDIGSTLLISIGHILLFYYAARDRAPSPVIIALLTLVMNVVLVWLLAATRMPELNFVVMFAIFLLIGQLHQMSWQRTIYFSLLSIVVWTIVKNSVYALLLKLHFATSLPYYTSTPSVIQLVSLVLLVGICIALRRYIRMAGRALVASRFFKASFVLLAIAGSFLVVANYPKWQWLAKWHALYGEQLYVLVLLVVVILLVLVVLYTYYTKERFVEAQEERARRQLLEYVEKLEFLHEELATFRHDYSNVLLSLEHAITTNNMQEVQDVYTRTIAPTMELINYQQLELTKLSRIEQPELKSLLSVKVLTAQRQGLHVTVDIPQPVAPIALPSEELLRIVSVLIDNALEAASETASKQLQIAIFPMESSCYIVVKNAIQTNVQPEQLFQKHYSTKGTQRGLGLFSVQRLIDKYPYVTLSTKVQDSFVVQELLIKRPFM